MGRRIKVEAKMSRRLQKLLRTLPEEERKAIAAAMRAQLAPIAAEIRARAPVATGRTRDRVRLTVSARTLRGKIGVKVPYEVRKGSGIYKNLAWLLERGSQPSRFGRKPTGPHPLRAQPFFYPVVRAHKNQARAAVLAAVKAAVHRAGS